MKAGIATLVVAALASGGLTIKGADTLGPRCDAFLERVSIKARSCAGSMAARVAGVTVLKAEPHEPGPTLALAVLDGFIVGLDGEAYVTLVTDAITGGDHPSLTGLAIADPEEGNRISRPEVTVGLSVVKAFGRHEDLSKMLSEVNVSDLEHPRAILKGGTIVEVGAGGYARKIDRLHQVLLQSPHLDMFPRRVDLRFDRQVILEYSQVRNRARKEV